MICFPESENESLQDPLLSDHSLEFEEDGSGNTSFLENAADRHDRADLARLALENDDLSQRPTFVRRGEKRRGLGENASVTSEVSSIGRDEHGEKKGKKAEKSKKGKDQDGRVQGKSKRIPKGLEDRMAKRAKDDGGSKLKTSERFPMSLWPEGCTARQIDDMTSEDFFRAKEFQRDAKIAAGKLEKKKSLPGMSCLFGRGSTWALFIFMFE